MKQRIESNSPFFKPKTPVTDLGEHRKEKKLLAAKGEPIGMLSEDEIKNNDFLQECLEKGYIVLGTKIPKEMREEIKSDLRDVLLQENVPEEIVTELKENLQTP